MQRRSDRGGKSPLRHWAALAAATAVSLLVGLPATAGPAGADSSSLPPVPAGLHIQSRCAALVLSNHVVDLDGTITANAGPARPEACNGSVGWDWNVGIGLDVKSGCKTDGTTCSLKATSSSQGWDQVCLEGNSGFGEWESCDYYDVLGEGTSVIDGYVTDRDKQGVAGTEVRAVGDGGGSALSGSDGYYAIVVKPGSYHVVPSGGPQGKEAPSYAPSESEVSVAPSRTSKANFELLAGIELQLTFGEDSVPATGLEVVTGTITTSEYGKPLPNDPVQLTVMPGQPVDQAVTDAPLASICAESISRIWPQGYLNGPDALPVDVTTDANGHYKFSITVGSRPGVWRLQAWAETSEGLALDPTASETKAVTFTSLGSARLSNFVGEVNLIAKSTHIFDDLENQGSLESELADVTAHPPSGANLGGLAYALGQAKQDETMIIFPADSPPVAHDGVVVLDARNDNDLIIDPNEWTGAGLPSTITDAASLYSIIQKGLLPDVPTLEQWATGADVKAWKTISGNSLAVPEGAFEEFGWGYGPGFPPLTTQIPGSCY
jgi:hypothetical protein